MSKSSERRSALKQLALLMGASSAVGALELVDGSAAAQTAGPPHLDPSDPTAVELGYNANAATIDPKKFPTFRAGERCSSCVQLRGREGQGWRPCNLFAGVLVSADGWCRLWTPKS